MKSKKIVTDYGWYKEKKITSHSGMTHFKKIIFLKEREGIPETICDCFATVICGEGVVNIGNNAFLVKRGDTMLVTHDSKFSLKSLGHIKLKVYHN